MPGYKREINGKNREVLQNEFRYDFRKGPREISAGTVTKVLKATIHVNTINTVKAEISRGPFRKSYWNSFCKTSLIFLDKCLEGKCREKKNHGKVQAWTIRHRFAKLIDSAKSPSTKTDGLLVNFRHMPSNRHGRPWRMLIWTSKGTLIGLWTRPRDLHKSGPQSWWSLASLLAKQNEWNEKGWPGYDRVVHGKNIPDEYLKGKCHEKKKTWKSSSSNHTTPICPALAESIKRFRSARQISAVWFEPGLFQVFFPRHLPSRHLSRNTLSIQGLSQKSSCFWNEITLDCYQSWPIPTGL